MSESSHAGFGDAVRPAASLSVYKGHGLGNDYLVVERGDGWPLDPERVRRVCHRTLGVGSDGVVWVDPEASPFPARGFNPDGSEFERSGNGLRVLASHLHRTGRVGEEPFRVRIGGEEVGLRVLGVDGDRYDVVVEMGAARIGAGAVTLDPSRLRAGALPDEVIFDTGAGVVTLVPVSVGNPHAVLWGAPEGWAWRGIDVEAAVTDLTRFGPAVTDHPAFAEGTNVQLARVVAPTRIEALVWERGAGRTTASGTSSCAVAASAVATGRVPAGEIEVVMEGGALQVTVTPALDVRLRGPVEAVMTGRMAPGLVGGEA